MGVARVYLSIYVAFLSCCESNDFSWPESCPARLAILKGTDISQRLLHITRVDGSFSHGAALRVREEIEFHFLEYELLNVRDTYRSGSG